MTNHIHLLIRINKANLSEAMQALFTAYAMRFNIKYERKWKAYHFQGTVPFHDKQGCYHQRVEGQLRTNETVRPNFGSKEAHGPRRQGIALYWDELLSPPI